MQGQLVQCRGSAQQLPVAVQFHVQQQALLDAKLAAQDGWQDVEGFSRRDVRQKTQSTQIDAQQRNVQSRQDARGGQQRAIAAQHDTQVGAFGRQALADKRIRGGLPVGSHLRPADPAAQLRQHRT